AFINQNLQLLFISIAVASVQVCLEEIKLLTDRNYQLFSKLISEFTVLSGSNRPDMEVPLVAKSDVTAMCFCLEMP
ncbi:hypothetical protein ACQP3J_33980, partial [Escherichia coli]